MKAERIAGLDVRQPDEVPVGDASPVDRATIAGHEQANEMTAASVDETQQDAQRTALGRSIEERSEAVPAEPDSAAGDFVPAAQSRSDSMGAVDVFADAEPPAAAEIGNGTRRGTGKAADRQVAEINGTHVAAENPLSENYDAFTDEADFVDEETDGDELRGEPPELSDFQIELIELHSQYVPAIAKRTYLREFGRAATEEELEDAVADGNLGLVLAAHKLDLDKASPDATTHSRYFDELAQWQIMRGLRQRVVRHCVTVDNGDGGTKRIDKIVHNKPSVLNGTATSLDKTNHTNARSKVDAEETLYDQLPAADGLGEERFAEVELRTALVQALDGIPKKEDRDMFLRKVIGGQSQADIARVLGKNEMYVSRKIARVRKHVIAMLTEY